FFVATCQVITVSAHPASHVAPHNRCPLERSGPTRREGVRLGPPSPCPAPDRVGRVLLADLRWIVTSVSPSRTHERVRDPRTGRDAGRHHGFLAAREA